MKEGRKTNDLLQERKRLRKSKKGGGGEQIDIAFFGMGLGITEGYFAIDSVSCILQILSKSVIVGGCK